MKLVAVNIGDLISVKDFANKKLGRKLLPIYDQPFLFTYGNKKVFLFTFGSFVIVEPDEQAIEELIAELKPFVKNFSEPIRDEYSIIHVNNLRKLKEVLRNEGIDYIKGKKIYVTDEACYLFKKKLSRDLLAVISFVLAQSVALEKIEEKADACLETAMSITNSFERKGLFLHIKKIVKSLIEIVRVRHDVLSNLMILEKPEMVWDDPQLDEIFEEMRDIFEIDERFEAVDKKLNDSFEMASFISDLLAIERENVLEILIIVLIAIEILLGIFVWS